MHVSMHFGADSLADWVPELPDAVVPDEEDEVTLPGWLLQ